MDASKDAKLSAKPVNTGRMIDLSRVIAKEPEKPKRTPHPCIAVVPNRAQATVHFLRKKIARGIALSDQEKELLAKFEDDVDAEEAATPAPAAIGGAGAASPSVGDKRKREPEPPVLSMSARMEMSLEEILAKGKGKGREAAKDGKAEKAGSSPGGGPKRPRNGSDAAARGSSGRGKSRSPAPHRRGR